MFFPPSLDSSISFLKNVIACTLWGVSNLTVLLFMSPHPPPNDQSTFSKLIVTVSYFCEVGITTPAMSFSPDPSLKYFAIQ